MGVCVLSSYHPHRNTHKHQIWKVSLALWSLTGGRTEQADPDNITESIAYWSVMAVCHAHQVLLGTWKLRRREDEGKGKKKLKWKKRGKEWKWKRKRRKENEIGENERKKMEFFLLRGRKNFNEGKSIVKKKKWKKEENRWKRFKRKIEI